MQKIINLAPTIISTEIAFTRDGDYNVHMSLKIMVANRNFTSPYGSDETVIEDGNLRISSVEVIATNSNTGTEFEITGDIESKKPYTGLTASRLLELKILLEKIQDDDIRDELEGMLLS